MCAENWNHSFGKWQGQKCNYELLLQWNDRITECMDMETGPSSKGMSCRWFVAINCRTQQRQHSVQVLNGVRRSWSALINWGPALCGGRKTTLPHLIAGRKGELIRFIKHWLIQVMNTITWHYYSARFWFELPQSPK